MYSASVPSFYDLIEKDASGADFSFSNFAGKVVYGVNVASECGDTAAGYDLLASLSKLKEKGVEVALFPCNQVKCLSMVQKNINNLVYFKTFALVRWTRGKFYSYFSCNTFILFYMWSLL
jgi:glutathione peroxidase-family protein